MQASYVRAYFDSLAPVISPAGYFRPGPHIFPIFNVKTQLLFKGFEEVGLLAHLTTLSTKNTEEHPPSGGFHLQTASKLQLQNLQQTLVSYTSLALSSGFYPKGAPSGYGF